VLRRLAIASASLYFVHSFIYGAGRGMSAVPLDHEGLAHLRTATYLCLLVGACFVPKRVRAAVALLSLGIIGRAFLEWKTSIAKGWYLDGSDLDPSFVALIALAYAANFVIPSLLLIDSIRWLRSRPTSQGKLELRRG